MNNDQDWDTRWNAALREQHDQLFDSETHSIKTQFAEYNPCPVCESEMFTPLYSKDGFNYVKCQKCSMVFMNPHLNKDATQAFYNSNVNSIYNETKFDAVSSVTMLDDKNNYENLDIIDQYVNGDRGKILEIGCAKGFFLTKAKDRGYLVYGVELNEKNCLIAKKMIGDTIYNNDLFDVKFPDAMFDVIYMRDVIEHIQNPNSLFKELRRIAKPGALLFIETHNIDSLINTIIREKHTVIFGFEHPTHWSPKTLLNILKQHGFVRKKVIYKSLDFTISDIIHYFIEPTFTTVFLWSISAKRKKILNAVRYPFLVLPLCWLDRTITPMIANIVRKGSVMKIIVQKK